MTYRKLALKVLIINIIIGYFSAYATHTIKGYAGANVNLNNFILQEDGDFSVNIPGNIDILNNTHIKTDNTAAGGSIFLGIDTTFNSFIIGLTGGATIPFSNFNTEFTTEFLLPPLDDAVLITHGLAQLKNIFFLGLKAGVLLRNNMAFYGMIGPAWLHVGLSLSSTFASTSGGLNALAQITAQQSSYKCGLLLGLGLSHLIHDKFEIGVEFTNQNYSKLKFPTNIPGVLSFGGTPVPGAEVQLTSNFKASTSAIAVKFSYLFNIR